MAQVTYVPRDAADPAETRTFNTAFSANVPVEVADKDALAALSMNPWFTVEASDAEAASDDATAPKRRGRKAAAEAAPAPAEAAPAEQPAEAPAPVEAEAAPAPAEQPAS